MAPLSPGQPEPGNRTTPHRSSLPSRSRVMGAARPSLSATGQPDSQGGERVSAREATPRTPLEHSSWIHSILYKRLDDGDSYLALFLRTEPGDEPVALLYGPKYITEHVKSVVPPWLPGLLAAGIRKGECGHRSVGLAYNRLLKGRQDLSYQRVEGAAVEELRRMLS